MSQDKLHDALNLLDDKMIEDVDKLRQKRNVAKPVRYRWASVAASFLIGIIGLAAVSAIGIFVIDMDNTKNAGAGVIQQEESHKGSDIKGEPIGDAITKGEITITGDELVLYVKLEEMIQEGFCGTVNESDEEAGLVKGDKIIVKYEDDLELTEGCVVKVYIIKTDDAISVIEDGDDKKYVVYATTVESIEGDND